MFFLGWSELAMIKSFSFFAFLMSPQRVVVVCCTPTLLFVSLPLSLSVGKCRDLV